MTWQESSRLQTLRLEFANPAASPAASTVRRFHLFGDTSCIGFKQIAATSFYKNGGSGETRTRDQRIKSPLLYRLSYRPSTG